MLSKPCHLTTTQVNQLYPLEAIKDEIAALQIVRTKNARLDVFSTDLITDYYLVLMADSMTIFHLQFYKY